jgi:hypothetical protein
MDDVKRTRCNVKEVDGRLLVVAKSMKTRPLEQRPWIGLQDEGVRVSQSIKAQELVKSSKPERRACRSGKGIFIFGAHVLPSSFGRT